MARAVSDSDPRPPYVQIAADLREQIERGELKPRDRLPSMRQLADVYGVAQMTINHALRTLKSEGRVETWQGRGSFVAESPDSEPNNDDLSAQVRALTRTVRSMDDRLAKLEKLSGLQ